MFGSTILDIVIGMVFVFLLLSLVCSALNEALEGLLKNRAKDLERGIRDLFGNPATAGRFLDEFYNHGLINSLFQGAYPPKSKRDLPSYIPAPAFALAVMDMVKNPPAPDFTLPPNVQAAVTVLQRQAGGDEAKLQAGLEEWFNHRMDRVTGWYKRRVQWIVAALALIVSVGLNADAIQIARTIANSGSVRQGLVAAAQAQASQSVSAAAAATGTAPAGAAGQTAIKQIQDDVAALGAIGLGIGWQPWDLTAARKAADKAPTQARFERIAFFAGSLAYTHLEGWLLTAIAISLGAPFWFDLLNKIVGLRSTLKPEAETGVAPAAPALQPQPIVVTLPAAAAPQPAPIGLPGLPLPPPGQPGVGGPVANGN